MLREAPHVATRHDVELLAVAPELADVLPLRRATLTALTSPRNRTRFYPSGRTTRLAHGLVEFVADVVGATGGPTLVLVTDVDDADPTDLEWLAILLRRSDPGRCRVVVHTRDATGPQQLRPSLSDHADRHVLDAPGGPTGAGSGIADDVVALAERYVASDGTARSPRLAAAYEAVEPAVRAALHDARAHELDARGEPSLALGAVPYHRERGSDPTGVGARALLAAIEHCVLEGFYDAVVDLAPRCLAVLSWATQVEDCWLVTAKATTALTGLDRPGEAEAWYDAACAATTDPSVHLQSAYGRAMLFTRFYSDDRRSHHKAKSWVNTAISLSSLLPDDQRRAFNLTFNENGLALVEMHLGELSEALRLVEVGMARLDDEVEADQHGQHRSVLAYNRAQLLVAVGRLDEALAAYDDVIAGDPHHSEYYFERASVLRRLGRTGEAMRDYDAAIEASPPYPEPHVNKADLAAELGDLDVALAELSYVIELDPAFEEAHARRAALRLQVGDLTGASDDVREGLRLRPEDARLHCLDGAVAMESGDAAAAVAAFDRAVVLEPASVEALGNRAVLRFDGRRRRRRRRRPDRSPGRRGRPEPAGEPGARLRRDGPPRRGGRRLRPAALQHPDVDRESLGELRQRCLAPPAVAV